ncbi:MAG: hypothetical protein JNM65_01230 [Verrucomicrobiaceae bacterium]|nr:hypothetical protein [Verrucomicrobiaceae bacterium]
MISTDAVFTICDDARYKIKQGMALEGLEPSVVCSVVAAVPISAEAVQVIYKTPDGTIKERFFAGFDGC